MVKYVLTISFWMLIAVSLSAIEFQPSPLMSELSRARFDLERDEFDEFGNEPKDLETNKIDKAQVKSVSKVSAYKAGLYSLILPGWGQRMNGRYDKSRIFLMMEAASWIGFAGYRIYGDWKKNDLIDFGASAAGAKL